MDQAEFDRLLSTLPAVKPKGEDPAQAPKPQTPGQMLDAALDHYGAGGGEGAGESRSFTDSPEAREGAMGSVIAEQQQPESQAVEAAATGALRGVFETKDFLFGESKPEEWSNMRATNEARDKELREGSMLNGFSSGIGQFAIGMIGLGKLQTTGKVAATALESAKSALVGSVVFDPHEERLSNLVQGTPLANPITAWLAADPEDSNAEGRIKAALESIALDGAIIGTFMLSTKILKALRKGNTEEAAKLATQLEKEAANAQQPPAEAQGQLVAGEGPDLQPESGGLSGASGAADGQAVQGVPEQAAPGGDGGAGDAQAGSGTPSGQAAEGPQGAAEEVTRTSFKDFTRETPEGEAGYAYHATSADNALSIADDGKMSTHEPSFGTDQETWPDGSEDMRSYFGETPGGTVAFTPEGQPALLRVKRDGRFKSERGTKDLYTTDEIAAEEIEYLAADGTWKPLKGGQAMAEEIDAQVVTTPTEAAQAADTELMSPNSRIRFTDENTDEVLAGMEADAKAMEEHGGWYAAIEAGHTFGKGEGVPWVKLNNDASLDDFMARVVDAAEERLDKLKGGKVLSDEKVERLIKQRVALYDEDPSLLLGLIQNSGKNATRMVADMEAGYLVSNKMMQDAFALATRYRMGDYSEFGTKEAMLEALRQRLSIASSVYGAARSVTAASGRAVRRMRGQFKIDPEMVSKLSTLDGDLLAELIVVTKGNPRNMAKLAQSSWWDKVVDFGQFMLINNLVSGPKTHLINILTNSYMVGARPMERILGSVVPAVAGNKASRTILRESVKQYTYMGSAFVDGFGLAAKAFLYGDSTLSPHNTELWKGAGQGSANILAGWKPMDSVGGVLSNALKVATGALSIPTRTLGSVDELVKQTVYRSKVAATAHIEAVELAASIKGKKAQKDFVRQYVTDQLAKAFDLEGRGINPVALREANIATFQQDLLAGTLGKTINMGVNNHPGLRLVLPFVKTPTNVIRYGWKMSPGLNVLQREYRAMLLGQMGKEAQAQATGQMAMGMLWMGAAAYLVSNGNFTGGGGDSDWKELATLKATGWQPYSLVFENDNGEKTYIPIGRLDPIAIPMGIVADIQDALHILDGEETPEVQAAIGALLLAMSKQFTSKTYLQSLDGAIEAFTDKEAAKRFAHQTAANFIPFSAAARQWNPDPYLREARDLTDRLMATIPGMSKDVPARYDWLGEPVLARKGLWTNADDNIVDLEVQRLLLEGGSAMAVASPYHGDGVDLRDVTMSDGKNAYEEYQKLSGKPNPRGLSLRQAVTKVMNTEAYKKAPDGDIAVKGTKLWLLHPTVSRYRAAALKRLKRDPMVRDALSKKQMKVIEHYRGQKEQPQAAPKPTLGQVGKAFGVELDALLGPTRQP